MTIIACFLAYLIGSIPFGLLLTRAAGLGDLRAIGSGNIGATNVARTGHKGLAVFTLVLDGAKGALAVWMGAMLGAMAGYAILTSLLCALLAVIGHIFPLWLKFRGGKGVATTLGAYLVLNPLVGAVAMATWLIVFVLTRYSSLSAILALALTPFAALWADDRALALACALIGLLVIWRHKTNIQRILNGTEHRFRRS